MSAADGLDDGALATRLSQHVGAPRAGVAGENYITDCVAEGIELVKQIIGAREVPEKIVERAVVEAAADLFWRKQARSGVATFEADGALETVRVGLDPTRAARAVLAPWLGPAIA